jgi:nitrite reductase/ring-hydroxylating ferredoxin subunit
MNAMNHGEKHSTIAERAERRSFLTRVTAVVSAALLVLFPFAAGWGVVVDPLRRRHGSTKGDDAVDAADFARICPLAMLPADGMPHEFAVTADVADAWTRAPARRIGSVFITRTDAGGQANVRAFNTTCPHLGCAVEFDAAEDHFTCPCHESAFGKNGDKLFGPSLRGLDPLEVKLLGAEGAEEVWVRFQRFRAGIAERTPV